MWIRDSGWKKFRSGVQDGKKSELGSGWKKVGSGIRDKYPGSATLVTVLFSDFKNPHKKSAKQASSSLFMNSILWNRKMKVENQTKHFYWRRLKFLPRNLD
jgi:hypothetical protein